MLPWLGHCPHDEAPELVNPILVDWLRAGGTGEPGSGQGEEGIRP